MRTLSTPPRLSAGTVRRWASPGGRRPRTWPARAWPRRRSRPRRRRALDRRAAVTHAAAPQGRLPRLRHGSARPWRRRAGSTVAADAAGGIIDRGDRDRREHERSRSGSAPGARSRRRRAESASPSTWRPLRLRRRLGRHRPCPGYPGRAAALSGVAAPRSVIQKHPVRRTGGRRPLETLWAVTGAETRSLARVHSCGVVSTGSAGGASSYSIVARVGLSDNRKASKCQQSKY